jgi:hypothetical protein
MALISCDIRYGRPLAQDAGGRRCICGPRRSEDQRLSFGLCGYLVLNS